jgi:hypothetical protein
MSSTPVFGRVRVAHLFSFLCCPVMCLRVLSSVLWCPLRFPHKHDDRFIFTPVVCRRDHVFITLFVFVCVQWRPTHIVVCFLFCVSSSCVLCTQCCQFLWIVHPCCQFLWIVHSWLFLRFSLTFLYIKLVLLSWCWTFKLNRYPWTDIQILT